MFDRGTRDSQQKKEEISPTVQFPGHAFIRKSTLTSLHNENPNLSHVRLICVRQPAIQGSQQAPASTLQGIISLYDDYVVCVKENKQFILDKLQRMRKKGNRGYIEYRQPLKF